MKRRGKSISKRRTTPSSTPVLISCPDCAGVLSTLEEGLHEHQTYSCQVGHRYSTRSLIDAKEEQVEKVLWSVSAFLVHIEILYAQMLRELRKFDGGNRKHLQNRIREAGRQRRVIEDLIHVTHAWDG